jgi:N-acetylmuramoyl-L-alanine amidase
VDQEACRRIGVRSIVAVPLLTEEGVAGLIAAFCRETHGVSDGDIRSLSLLAELALAALQPEEELPAARRAAISPAAAENIAPSALALSLSSSSSSSSLATTSPRELDAKNSPADEEYILPNLETLRSTLSPVTEEREVVNEAPAQVSEDPVFASVPDLRMEPPRKSRRLLWAVLILACLALILAGLTFWWWHSRRAASLPEWRDQGRSELDAMAGAAAPAPGGEPMPAVAKDIPTHAIVGIRHWTSTDSSTVAIDLMAQVQYEAHRLSNPERIYFDLRDTTLASGVPGSMEIGDALLSRIRVAQPTADLTRVVLETKNNPNFSVKLENNPYRLLIEIRNAAGKPKNSAKVDLFAPPHGAGRNRRLSAATPEQGTWLAPADASTHPESAALPGAARGLRIVLDAGHGGWDMGTVGRKGLLEKDLVLDIVARLGELVTSRLGAEVIYTRRDDTYVALEKRTEAANFAQADLFLSVHANYSNSPNARGVETYYTNTYSSARARMPDNGAPDALSVDWLNVDIREKVQQSRGLANDVQQALYHTLAAKSPALRNRGVKEASYVVLTGTTMPAILAEVSFVSSPEDETKLESATYRQQIAEGLYKGIAAYSESLHRVNVASGAPATTAGQ